MTSTAKRPSKPTPPELLSLLSEEGALADAARCPMNDDELLEAFRWMLLTRVFDERAFSLQRQGRLGTFSPCHGQEASVVGSAIALDPSRDYIVPQYRELPALLRHGYPLASYLLYNKGDVVGARIPDDVKMLPIQIALAAQLPHAVGLAWGLRRQGLDGVVCVYFGDGASSEGDAHEAMNLAGVLRAPVVFFLQNNGWAISTSLSKQTAASRLAARGDGYGMPGVHVDGNDVLAVYEACRAAVARARAGEGPTLVESVSYRLGPHNTADDPTRYRSDEEVAEHERRDPIERFRRFLSGRGLMSAAQEEALRAELVALVNEAVAEMERHPGADVAAVFEHVYAEPPARVIAQRIAAEERAAP